MTNYSARHWAEVAKQEADRASQGGGQADLTDYVRKIDDTLEAEITSSGTYNGLEVTSGEVFVHENGRIYQYTKQEVSSGSGAQGFVWESLSQNSPANSSFSVTACEDDKGTIIIPNAQSTYVTISNDFGHNWRSEFLPNFKFSGHASNTSVPTYSSATVFNGAQFVYFGSQGPAHSADGLNWTSSSYANSMVLESVTGAAFINGTYVVSDASGQVYYSIDNGVTLTPTSITDGRVTMSAGFALCVRGNSETGEALSISHDGINWITRSPNVSFPAPEMQAVTNGSTIVLVGPCSTEVSAVHVSPDGGLSWTSMPLPLSCKPRLVYTGGKFIILQNEVQSDTILWSYDGYAWNTEQLMVQGSWRTVVSSYIQGTWTFFSDLDTIVASEWNTDSSSGTLEILHNLIPLSLTSSQIDQKVFDNVGRGVQLGFNGTLSEGVLTFEVPSENAGEYTLKHLYNYEIDLLFEAVGQLDDSTQIVIKNGTQNINIVNAKHDDYSTPVTVGDMKQIMKYSADIGFRWIFDARYTVTTDEQPVFVMPSTVTNSPTTQDGVTVFEGDNHPVVIKGQAGTTATGLQVQDSLEAGSAVDFEHYRSGDQYGIQFTVDNSKATTGSTQYWRSYVTDAGVSVTDFTTQGRVLVPWAGMGDYSEKAASTKWVRDHAMKKFQIHEDVSSLTTGVMESFYTSSNTNEIYYNVSLNNTPVLVQLDYRGSFPSSEYTDIEVVASGTTFTAPCAGFFAVRGTTTAADGRIELHNVTAGDLTIKSVEPNTNRVVAAYLPCNTGDTLRVYYADIDINLFRFVKAKGETL